MGCEGGREPEGRDNGGRQGKEKIKEAEKREGKGRKEEGRGREEQDEQKAREESQKQAKRKESNVVTEKRERDPLGVEALYQKPMDFHGVHLSIEFRSHELDWEKVACSFSLTFTELWCCLQSRIQVTS